MQTIDDLFFSSFFENDYIVSSPSSYLQNIFLKGGGSSSCFGETLFRESSCPTNEGRRPNFRRVPDSGLYTRYPIVARALGLAAAECVARAKVSCIQDSGVTSSNDSPPFHDPRGSHEMGGVISACYNPRVTG